MHILKPFKLDRRSFIRGAGVTACLPWLECMAESSILSSGAAPNVGERNKPPKRMAYIYVPNGVSLPGLQSEYKAWNWFPEGQGRDYQFTKVLESLTPYKSDLTVVGGLSHPKSRQLLGHIAGDTFLTAGDLRGDYNNQISVDQVAAQVKKDNTRYPSLVLSADGGIGFKSRASTLSFDMRGQALPSEHNHRSIFERYFSLNGQTPSAQRKQSLQRKQKLVDLLLEDTKRLNRKLGINDRQKLDEHMANLYRLEEQIERNEAWMNIPLKPFNADYLDLAVDAKIDPEAYIRSSAPLLGINFLVVMT